ncbi:MAG: phosphotransferase family protein [Proteobacteria bacterium]|nr:phosphotransferase family protein [Pseudomonadota bacterium]MYJ95698.1 phosphotransferase family protein [Pseudomonadota bacterium]
MIEPATLERLAGLLGVAAAELQVQPLPGGISNRGCLLSRGSDRWAVRVPLASGAGDVFDTSQAFDTGVTPGTGLTLRIEDELRVLEVAGAAGLAPEVLAHDADSGALVTRYLTGAEPLTAEQARSDVNIERIATVLRRLHGLPAPVGVGAFQPTEPARVYTRSAHSAPDSEIDGVNELRRWSTEFRQLAETHEAEFSRAVLCHNDLVAANILDDGRLWLVDFEYAVRADPILDLAGLAGLNGFGPTHCNRLLDAYYGPGCAPIDLAQLNQVIRLVRLMAFFWALVHGGNRATDDQARFAASMAAVLR